MLFLRTFGQLFLDPLMHPTPEIPAGSIVVISQILGLAREQHHGGAVMRFIVCMYMQWDIREYVKREKNSENALKTIIGEC